MEASRAGEGLRQAWRILTRSSFEERAISAALDTVLGAVPGTGWSGSALRFEGA